jgi:hypothetical protein
MVRAILQSEIENHSQKRQYHESEEEIMPKLELLFDALNPNLYPEAAVAAAREIQCEYDLPVTYVKAVRLRNGARETVHEFRNGELQLFPAQALRNGDSKAITAAARRLSLLYIH